VTRIFTDTQTGLQRVSESSRDALIAHAGFSESDFREYHESDTTYNGWTNYATWRVNLELCDDLCNSYHADREVFASVYELSERLQEYVEGVLQVEGQAPELTYDYALAFISDVNWYEIAEHWTDELIEQEEEEEEEDTDAA
jgi:hypothetical protein